MGSAFSSGSIVSNNNTLNIKNIQELKEQLGYCSDNLSSNNSMCSLPTLINYNSSFNPIMFPVDRDVTSDF